MSSETERKPPKSEGETIFSRVKVYDDDREDEKSPEADPSQQGLGAFVQWVRRTFHWRRSA
jgi:hypothetical protein